MNDDEARSLGRAIRSVRIETGMTQLKLATAVGVGSGQIGIWERGYVPTARGSAAHPARISRDQLAAVAAALDCRIEHIVGRAVLSATSRLLFGVDPLGSAGTVVGGMEYDLTGPEVERVQAFIAGLIAARDLH